MVYSRGYKEIMRTKSSLKNITVNMVFFMLKMLLSFFSKKIFIDNLGTEVNGLNVLLVQILGFLNMAELGIGTAATFMLYKPIIEKKYNVIEDILSALKEFYNKIALTILIIGIMIAVILPIFIQGDVDRNLVIICFLLYLLSTSASYLVTDKIILITADQKAYKINLIIGMSEIALQMTQIFFLIYFKSYYLYVISMVLFSFVKYIVINIVVKNEYKNEIRVIKKIKNNKYKIEIFSNVKYIFFLNLSGQIVFNTDYIIISYFLGLNSVTLFSNYVMLINLVQGIISQITLGIFSSIGNLIAENDDKKVYNVFKETFMFYYYIATISVIITYNLINDFIQIWLGRNFILDRVSVLLLMINMFVFLIRWSVESFKNAKGIFKEDVPYAILEMMLNLVFSIILVQFMGIKGVILGTVISNVCVLMWAKPKLVYKLVFNKSIKYFYLLFSRNLVYLGGSILVFNLVVRRYVSFQTVDVITFLIKASIIVCSTVLIVTLFYFKDVYFRKVIIRIFNSLGLSRLVKRV